MRVVTPSHERILELQQLEGCYYFSGAIDVLLRMYGLSTADQGPVLVTREADWHDSFDRRATVFEGRLSEGVADSLSISARDARAERLALFDAEGELLCTLMYGRPSVRWIPSRRGEKSEPYVFVSEDPLWNASGIRYQTFDDPRGAPILFADLGDGIRSVVGVRTERALVFGVPLLDILMQHLTPPPYDVGYFEMVEFTEHLARLERWLLDRIADLESFPPPSVWPDSCRAALTVRHDYDRPLDRSELRDLLAFYRELGIRSTWFWRLCHADRDQVADVLTDGHEVALHTEAPTQSAFRQEIDDFDRLLNIRPAGYAAHGGIPAPGNLGLRQIEWAIEAGMDYGETLGSANVLPHEAVVIRNGVPTASNLVVPAEHRGLDITLAPDGHCFETLLPEAKQALSRGEHCVLMNHPDVHVDVLKRLLNELDLSGVWLATLSEVAEWFVRSQLGSNQRP